MYIYLSCNACEASYNDIFMKYLPNFNINAAKYIF